MQTWRGAEKESLSSAAGLAPNPRPCKAASRPARENLRVRQDPPHPGAHHPARARRGHGAGRRRRRRQGPGPGPDPDRPGRAVRRGRRPPHRPREHPDDRPPIRPAAPRGTAPRQRRARPHPSPGSGTPGMRACPGQRTARGLASSREISNGYAGSSLRIRLTGVVDWTQASWGPPAPVPHAHLASMSCSGLPPDLDHVLRWSAERRSARLGRLTGERDEMPEMVEALDAVKSCARELGLDVEDAIVLRATNNTVAWLAPLPPVAKIAAGHHGRLAAEIEVARLLAAAGAPVVPPADGITARGYRAGRFEMTLWRYEDQDRL